MPTRTFFQLPEDKRRRVFDAAVEEFAEYPFSQASINRIVKAAEISRGSFYQYFADKEDVYLYLMQQIADEKKAVFAAYQPAADESFFEMCASILPSVFDWAEQKPLYNKIGLLMAQEDSNILMRFAEKIPDSRAWLVELLQNDQRAGRLRADVDAQLIADLYITFAGTLLREYYIDGTRESAVARANVYLDVLKNGLCPR